MVLGGFWFWWILSYFLKLKKSNTVVGHGEVAGLVDCLPLMYWNLDSIPSSSFQRQRQESQKLEVILDNVVSSRLAQIIWGSVSLKKLWPIIKLDKVLLISSVMRIKWKFMATKPWLFDDREWSEFTKSTASREGRLKQWLAERQTDIWSDTPPAETNGRRKPQAPRQPMWLT